MCEGARRKGAGKSRPVTSYLSIPTLSLIKTHKQPVYRGRGAHCVYCLRFRGREREDERKRGRKREKTKDAGA